MPSPASSVQAALTRVRRALCRAREAGGLRYHLSETIPKHGGTTCRIDVKPITLVTLGKKPDRRQAPS